MTQEILTGSIQQIQGKQIELTVRSINPTLNRGGEIFMSDAGINTEAPQAVRPVATSGELPALPRAGGMSLEGLTPAQQIDAKRTIKLIEDLGFKPKEVTSKGRTEQTAQSVVENAGLDSQDPVVLKRSRDLANKEDLTAEETAELLQANSGRISKAEELLKESLGRELTDAEKKAILRAHFVGFGEKGKDEKRDSGVFNVSQEQLAEKARILKDAGFDKEQRREIIESGLAAGAPPAPANPMDARNQAIADLANLNLTLKLADIRDKILALHAEAQAGNQGAGLVPNPDGISSETFDAIYKGFFERVKNVLNMPNPPVEVLALEQQLKQIKDLDDRTHEQRGPQENFINEYDFLVKQLVDVGPNNPQRQQFEQMLVDRVVAFTASGVNPSNDNIYDMTLKRIIQTDVLVSNPVLQEQVRSALDRLVVRIVGLPLQSDTGDFDIGFYGGINFASIKNLLLSMSQDPSYFETREIRRLYSQMNLTTRDAYVQFRDTRRDQNLNVGSKFEAMRIVHELNKMIVQNQLDAANQAAPQLGPEYVQALSKSKGVASVFRIMESGILDLMARDGYMAKGRYDALMGKAQSQETGRFDNSGNASIVKQIRKMQEQLGSLPQGAQAGLTQDMKQLLQMEDWEVDLAFNLGRNLYNILHRSAELSSWGRLPKGLKAFTNSVFGGFRNIYNPGLHVLERFKPGAGRGGYRLFEMFMDAMQRRRKTMEGYGDMNLEQVRGDLIKFFELPSIAGQRGFISSWKANEGTLTMVETNFTPQGIFGQFDIHSQMHLEEDGSKIFDRATGIVPGRGIGHFLDTDALTFINSAGEQFEWGKLSDGQKADYFRSLFFEPGTGGHGHDPVLRRDINIGLGVIYKTALGPAGGHHGHESHHLNEVKEQIRRLIWERAAEENPLAVLPYLHKLKFSADHAPVTVGQGPQARTEVVAGKTLLADVYQAPVMSDSKVKFMLLNEWRMSKIKEGNLNYTLVDAINEIDASMGVQRDPITHAITNQVAVMGLSLTQEEYELYDRIVESAKLASRDMANVRYGFVAFANDLPFEKENFDVLGNNAYQRHFGDVVQINSSTQAMIDAFDNLGTVKDFHGVVEVVGKFEKGITAVHGDAAAKDKAAPLVEAITRFFRRGENAGGEKFVEEDKKGPMAKMKRYFRQWDEVHSVLQQFHKANSIAQQEYNVEALALDRHQIYLLQEELMASGFMGHDQEEEFRKNFGGFLGFITRMMLEGFLRTGKLSTIITARGLLGSSFKGAIE